MKLDITKTIRIGTVEQHLLTQLAVAMRRCEADAWRTLIYEACVQRGIGTAVYEQNGARG